jgi:hypothetical protein
MSVKRFCNGEKKPLTSSVLQHAPPLRIPRGPPESHRRLLARLSGTFLSRNDSLLDACRWSSPTLAVRRCVEVWVASYQAIRRMENPNVVRKTDGMQWTPVPLPRAQKGVLVAISVSVGGQLRPMLSNHVAAGRCSVYLQVQIPLRYMALLLCWNGKSR